MHKLIFTLYTAPAKNIFSIIYFAKSHQNQTGPPHSIQNFAFSGKTAPHLLHNAGCGAEHSIQNFALAGSFAPQFIHVFIPDS